VGRRRLERRYRRAGRQAQRDQRQVGRRPRDDAEHKDKFPAWKAWRDAFVAGNGEANEKTGTLTMGRDARTITFSLRGLGVARMSSLSRGGGAHGGQVLAHEVELYCEGITLGTATGASAATAEPPRVAVNEGNDQGARDPKGIPRVADSVRKSYSSSRTKVQTEEKAEYATRTLPEKVESQVATKMKDLGWKESTREETGTVKDGTWRIDVKWERERTVARLTITRAKDGSTMLWWQVTTPAK
jgi:hypothetical protein